MSPDEYSAMSAAARKYASDYLSSGEIEKSTVDLLNAAICRD
jgi:hypothetical protein